MRIIRSILWLLVVVLLLVFVVQNNDELGKGVSLRMTLFVQEIPVGVIPMYGVMIFCLLAGLLLGGGWGVFQQLRLRGQLRRAVRLLSEKEKELDSLRNLPVLESQRQAAGEMPPAPSYDLLK
jgi:uncharacterized integral membrane protein